MPAKKPSPPKLKEVSVTYRAAVKANLGDFENADLDVAESETWDVSASSEGEVETLLGARYDVLKERVDQRVADFYVENSKNV